MFQNHSMHTLNFTHSLLLNVNLKNINVNIVAEGIENDKQRIALLDAGIAFGQGYHFGKPMSLNKLISQLKSDKPQ